MKKSLALIAIILGTSAVATVANAQNETSKPAIEVAESQDGFKEVQVADLPEAVQAALKTLGEGKSIKAAFYNAEKGITKVVFVSGEDQSESVVMLDKEGAEIKE